MQFVSRKVTHPNGQIDRNLALQQLESHPQFKKGSVIVSMKQEKGKWVATIHEPVTQTKEAAPPPFAPPSEDGPPSDDSAPSESKDDAPKKEEGESEDKPKKEEGGEKASLDSVMHLLTDIAKAVGVPVGGPGPEGPGPEGPLGPGGPDSPPLPPEGGAPHDETSPVPGEPNTKQIIHRKAPPGATPVGAPAFASVQEKTAAPKVASFEVEEPFDGTIKEAMTEIESVYGPYGYKVKKIREARNEQGQRVIRARVSVR